MKIMLRGNEKMERSDNEHGYCPNCGKDFDDTLIWDSFFDKYCEEEPWQVECKVYDV